MSAPHTPENLAERLAAYFSEQPRPGVLCAYLFGSHARRAAHRESDVDVGILLARENYPTAAERFAERVALSALLVDALDSNDIDLVILNDVPPQFARHIVTEGERVFCSDPDRDRDFVRDAQLRAADLEPFLRRTRRIKLESLGP